MPLVTEACVGFVHPTTIIRDGDALQPSPFDVHLNGGGAGVEAVLKQLFDHRSRPRNHLPGGDVINDVGWQAGDGGRRGG